MNNRIATAVFAALIICSQQILSMDADSTNDLQEAPALNKSNQAYIDWFTLMSKLCVKRIANREINIDHSHLLDAISKNTKNVDQLYKIRDTYIPTFKSQIQELSNYQKKTSKKRHESAVKTGAFFVLGVGAFAGWMYAIKQGDAQTSYGSFSYQKIARLSALFTGIFGTTCISSLKKWCFNRSKHSKARQKNNRLSTEKEALYNQKFMVNNSERTLEDILESKEFLRETPIQYIEGQATISSQVSPLYSIKEC